MDNPLMPVTTTWQIPYPNNSQPLWQGYQYTDDIGNRVDAILEAFEVDAARIEVPPYACLETNTPITWVGPDPWLISQFTQVNADTGNYTNLTNDPSAIVFPVTATGGHYLVGYYAQSQDSDAYATATVGIQIVANLEPQYCGSTSKVNMGTRALLGLANLLTSVDSTTGPVTLQGELNVAQTTIQPQARLYAIWIGDE
jgi:hypothetical protein